VPAKIVFCLAISTFKSAVSCSGPQPLSQMGGSRAGRLDLWGKRGGPSKMSVALVGDEVPLVGTAPTEARPSVAR